MKKTRVCRQNSWFYNRKFISFPKIFFAMQCKIRYYSLKSYLTCSMPLLPIFQAGVAFQLTFFIISHFWQIRTFGEKTFLIFCSAFLFKLPSCFWIHSRRVCEPNFGSVLSESHEQSVKRTDRFISK